MYGNHTWNTLLWFSLTCSHPKYYNRSILLVMLFLLCTGQQEGVHILQLYNNLILARTIMYVAYIIVLASM